MSLADTLGAAPTTQVLDTLELVEHCAAQGIETGIDTSALAAAQTTPRAALGRGTAVPEHG